MKSSCGVHVLWTFQWDCGSLERKGAKFWVKILTGRKMELLFMLCKAVVPTFPTVTALGCWCWHSYDCGVNWVSHWSGWNVIFFCGVNFQQDQLINLICPANMQGLELVYWRKIRSTFSAAVSGLNWWKLITKSHPQLSRCKSQCGHTYLMSKDLKFRLKQFPAEG